MRSRIRTTIARAVAISVALILAAAASAGPVEFGLAELNSAMAARNLKWKVKTELSLDPPESFRIEPYAFGGAYISGGDVRGLMYGLLEAAEQIRTNGRFAKTHGDRAAALRGVRIELGSALERAPEEFWRSYFQMLARNRFNRAHVVFQRLVRPYRSACVLSRAAADHAVDFTLGVAGEIGADEMGVLLARCPSVRSVAIEPQSPSREAILAAVQHAGRFVTVDPDGDRGVPGSPDSPVAVLRPPALWPPSFEIRAPWDQAPVDQAGLDQTTDAAHAADHAAFYWVWGRFGYDPKTKPPKGANLAEYEAARLAALNIAAAGLADAGGSDHVASAAGAVGNQRQGVASAKFTPLDIAGHLEYAAASLERSSIADFQAMAGMARTDAREQRSAYARALRDTEAPAAASSGANPPNTDRARSDQFSSPPEGRDNSHTDRPNTFYANVTSSVPASLRPPMTHKPYQTAASDQPLTVTLRIAMPKQATLVRLHYRTLDPRSREAVLEQQPAPEVQFTIPGSDLTGTWDLFYYFEVLNNEGSGWFEPDPLTAAPYFTVHIQAPRTGPN
ncbi:MAG TPA: hypothetical protein VGR73_20295 [Bryobacteraceae bacterium]|nr:hypothetical protein [Bryobacteraceae bacterium]